MSPTNSITVKLGVVLTTFISLTLTGILVAAPVEYVPAPGGVYVIVPEQQGSGENISVESPQIVQSTVEEIDAASSTGSGSLRDQNTLSEDSASIQQLAMPLAAPTIDNYANATYDGRNNPVGHVAADFAVNANGAATYNVPIAIPPGIADVQPSISLTYNSQAGDGVAGRGMEIAGLSRISRCGSTLAQDGVIRPVQLDSGDHFCLDGQRLIEIGRSGTTISYQTEVKGYEEITASFSTYYNQPITFTVKTIAGETIEYGSDYGSQVKPTKPGSTNTYSNVTDVPYPYAAWLISKTSDIKGNYIRYRYLSSNTISGAEYLLQRIEYTGTQFAQPYAAIHFDYEDRAGNKATTYLGGGALYQSKRLKKIRVTQGAAGSYSTNTVREYRLGYYAVDSNSAHSYDRLKSVEECGNYSESGNTLYCLAPTWFRWNGGYESESGNLFGFSGFPRALAESTYTPTDSDLQGDSLGFPGFYGQGYVLNKYGYADGWDYGTYKNSDDPKNPGKDYTLMGDVNGDGLTDIIGLKGTQLYAGSDSRYSYNYQVVASVSDGKTFQANAFHTSTTPLLTNVWLQKSDRDTGNLATLADVNGDGLSDLVLIGYYYVYVALSDGNSFKPPVKWRSQDISSNYPNAFTGVGGWARGSEHGTEQRYVMDINGDGLADLVGLSETLGLFAALGTAGNSKIFGSVGRISSEFSTDNSANYQFETDTANAGPIWNQDIARKISRFNFADVNGDGLPDAIRLSENGIQVALNYGRFVNGSYFGTVTRWDTVGSVWSDVPEILFSTNTNIAYQLTRFTPHDFADVNGDGLVDFVLFHHGGVRVAFSNGKSFLAPVKVSDSFGRTTDKYNVTNQSALTGCNDVASAYYYNDFLTTQNRPMWVDEHKDPRYLVDVNGDGRADILGFGSNGIYVALSQGNTFGPMKKWIDPNDTSFSYDACWRPGYNIRTAGDVTGDGLVDLIGIGFTGTHVGQNFVKPWRVEQIISGGYLPAGGASTYNGLHRSIDIDYDSLTTSNSYQRTSKNQYRGLPMYVVTAHHDSDGEIGSVRPHRSTLKYHYQDLKLDLQRGMQGFRFREVIDENAKTRTEEYYHQYFPLTGQPYVQRTYAKNAGGFDKKVKEAASTHLPTSSTPDNQGVYEVLLGSTLETDYTLKSGIRFKQLLTEYKNYDDCGQAKEVFKSLGNWNGDNAQPYEASYNVTTVNKYPSTGNCRDKSRLIYSVVNHAVSGQPVKSKKSSFVYYPDGLLHQEIIQPDNIDEQKITTTYGYNPVGEITSKTIAGLGGRIDKANVNVRSTAVNRTTTTNYTPDYRFVSSTIDPLGFTTEFEYDTRFGLVKKTTDANGLINQTRYNGFGQPYLKEAPQGGVIHTAYEWCNVDVWGAKARYCTTTKNLNMATSQYSRQYFDSVDRLLREESMGAGTSGSAARPVYRDKIYDVETGRLLQESLPYFFNPPKWVVYSYDSLGRTLSLKQPDGSTTLIAYDGLTTTTTKVGNQVSTEIRTPRGNVVKAIDAVGGSVNHVYDSLGNLQSTTVIAKDGPNNTGSDRSIQTSFDYDLRGNKTRMTDPDMGTWYYYYNALGELTLQVDAKDQSTVMDYDQSGRMVKREAFDESTIWTYHPQSVSISDRGHLQKITSVMKNNLGAAYTYEKSFVYNSYGQPLTVIEKVPGSGGTYNSNGNTYQFSRTYDRWGRLQTLTYPAIARNQPAVGITYEYDNALGHLEAISDSNNSSLKHWELTGVDADGKTQQEKLGGKVTVGYSYDTLRHPWITSSSSSAGGYLQLMEYQFDSLGNLKRRQDYLNNANETFEYDRLNRLTKTLTSYSGITTPLTSTNTYDGHGNLRSKDGQEYKYGSEAPYGEFFPSSFHQVNQLLENGNLREYRSYDANGNVTNAGQGRQLQWTSFNKPSYIQRLGPTASFLYNSDHQRMFQSATEGWTWYAGDGLLEHHEQRSSHRETLKYSLMVDGQQVGYIKQSFDRSWTPSTGYQGNNLSNNAYYLLKDHLGSTQVLVDANGNKLEDMSFSAWGERRAASFNPTAFKTPALDLLRNYALTEGFTGHEHDDAFGFINMKGRLYDPAVGRFLSADPFVQFSNFTQSYNRYSYVLNNPLSFTDPSGYFLSGLLGGIMDVFNWIGDNIRTIASIAVGVVTGGWGYAAFNGGFWGAVAGGAIGGFSGTLVATGSLEAAGKAAIFGALSGGLANSIGHGVGALGRFVERGVQRFGEVARSIAHGVARGTISVLQGGKFKHGFVSGFAGHELRGLGQTLGFGTPGTGSFGDLVGRTMVTSIAAGTISQWTGGKFANGAVSAAFTHLYNAERESFGSYFKQRVMTGQVRDDIYGALGAYVKIGSGVVSMAGGWVIKNFNPTVGGYMMIDGASIYSSGVTSLSNQIYGTSYDGDFMGGWYREAATNYGFSPTAGDMARAGTSLLTLGGAWTTQVPRVVPGSSWTYTETRSAVTQASAVELANDLYSAQGAFQAIGSPQ